MTTASDQRAQKRALLQARIAEAARRAALAEPDPQPWPPAPSGPGDPDGDPAGLGGVPDSRLTIEPDTGDGDVVRVAPLAISQRPIWWFVQLLPDSPAYNEIISITKTGSLDRDALIGAFADVVARHEAWRTTFEVRGGEPVQVVHRSVDIEIATLDLSGLTGPELTQAIVREVSALARPAYELSAGPLIRPLLVELPGDRHRLYLALHHLIFDGVTLYRIVLPELVALYNARVSGGRADLPPALPYTDFAQWEAHEVARPAHAANLEFQRRRLGGVKPLNLPVDLPRPARTRLAGAVESLTVPRVLTERLRAVAADRSATLFQTLAAAYAVLLHRLSGQDDVTFGTVTDRRNRPELTGVVGLGLSSTVLRIHLDDDPRFADTVARVRDDLADALDHHVPFDELVRELQPERDPAMHPVFQAAFVLEPPMKPVDQQWSLAQMEVEIGDAMGVAKFDLHLELDERPEGHLAGRLLYNTDLFHPGTARRIVAAFMALLDGIAADPASPVSALPVLSGAERDRILHAWNDTARAYPSSSTLADLLETQAVASPEAVAVCFGSARLTYRELHEAANALAHRIVAAGGGPGRVVALLCERSLEMVVGLLAIVKAGAAYLPLDPALPGARLEYLLSDSAAQVLVRSRQLAGELATAAHVVDLDGCLDGRAAQPPARSTVAGDPVYLLYTSGSTGLPKGVVVSHRALANLMTAMADQFDFNTESRVLALTTISFDIAAVEIWVPLMRGSRVVIANREQAVDPALLAGLIRSEAITIAQATPTSWQILVDSGWTGSPGMVALCGGETLPPGLAAALLDRCAAVWNEYGPTETTVWSTLEPVTGHGPLTIGRPIQNTAVYVLDSHLQPVPVGVSGELWIGGDGVADGYWNRPELTRERFVADPFRPGERMYRTGDLARFLPDGRLLHLGRLDQQLKLRGQRIEPGEIEAALLQLSGILSAAVVVTERKPGDQRLVAHLAAEPGTSPLAPAELRSALQRTLPEYMVPAAYVWHDALPTTDNGKLDRKALPAPSEGDLARVTRERAPRTPLERTLLGIWARLLGVDSVGLDEDFFDLGGHSLLAVRLVAELESQLGITVPVATLIDGEATVRALASRLPQGPAPTPAPASAGRSQVEVVRFDGDRTKTPLIVFFLSREWFLAMRNLQPAFAGDRPFIGVLCGLDASGRFPRDSSIEQIAREILPTVRELAGAGQACCLSGFSLAGLLAYEVADLLASEGRRVERLALLDTYAPKVFDHSLRASFERAYHRRTVRDTARVVWGRLGDELRQIRDEALSRLTRKPLVVFDEYGARRLFRAYSPSGHSHAMDVFVASKSAEEVTNPTLGWTNLHRGPVRVHHVQGDHHSIMHGGAGRDLGEALAKALLAAPPGEQPLPLTVGSAGAASYQAADA